MAFDRGNRGSSSNQQDDSWRAQGFLNASITLADGTTEKIDALKLFSSKGTQAKILAWLEKNPEKVGEFMAKKIVWTFNPATPKARSDVNFDL